MTLRTPRCCSNGGFVVALALALLAASAPAVRWLAPPPPHPATRLLVDAERVLAGTDAGLYAHSLTGAGAWELVLAQGAVRDLAASSAGLLIASAGGAHEWLGGAAAPQPLALGEAFAVAAGVGREWVASDSGLYVRRAGEPFERALGMPTGPVLGVRATPREVWAAQEGVLYRSVEGAAFEAVLRGLEEGWWELCGAVELDGSSLLAVPAGLWRVGADGPERLVPDLGRVRALVRAEDRLWLASERDVYALDARSPQLGAAAGLGLAAPADLAAAGGNLAVLTLQGVASIASGAAPAARAVLAPRASGDASDLIAVADVQRLALAYLELGPGRMGELDARVARAPWLPEVKLSVGVAAQRQRDRGRDQSYTAGDTRDLFDAARAHDRGRDLELALVWPLGVAADPDAALAVSRERRALVQLRDQVLERVTRLYFDRLRALGHLDSLAPGDPERAELVLRATELAAQLDGWTGGGFSRLLRSPAPAGRSAR